MLSAVVSGSYAARTSMSGRFVESLGTVTFNAVYDPAYETPASLVAAAGTYTGRVASSAGFQATTFTVSTAGVLTGAVPGCAFSGRATAHGKVNVFDLTVTFAGGSCVFGTSTLTGVAYFDAVTRTIYAAAPNAARTDGFVVVGNR